LTAASQPADKWNATGIISTSFRGSQAAAVRGIVGPYAEVIMTHAPPSTRPSLIVLDSRPTSHAETLDFSRILD
jgi:hypothetical protein